MDIFHRKQQQYYLLAEMHIERHREGKMRYSEIQSASDLTDWCVFLWGGGEGSCQQVTYQNLKSAKHIMKCCT